MERNSNARGPEGGNLSRTGQRCEASIGGPAILAELEAPGPSPIRLHPNLAQLYREKVANLCEALDDPATQHEAMELLRGLIQNVEMTPTEGGYEVVLTGEIAHMIGLSASKDGEKVDHALSSIKVVAGAPKVLDHRGDAFLKTEACPVADQASQVGIADARLLSGDSHRRQLAVLS